MPKDVALETDLTAEIDFQTELELLYSKHQQTQFVESRFTEAGFPAVLEKLGISEEFGIKLLAQMAIRKRTKINVLVGVLHSCFESEENPFQACSDAVANALKLRLISYDTERDDLVVAFELDTVSQKMVDRFQYPLPMVEPPQHVINNRQTGYRTIRGSLLLRDNHHEEDICLEHINRVNQQALSINEDVVAFVQNQWKNISKPKPGELQEDYDKRRKNYLKYTKGAYDVMQLITANSGNEFWITHKYDKRGRTYAQGYHIQPQGNDWNKACVQFAKAEPLNKE